MTDYQALLADVRQQEATLQFTRFTNDMALEIGLKLVEVARKNQKSVTIDITRNGHQLFHVALAGTAPDNDEWIKRKNRVVNRFNHSSYYMGLLYKSKGTTIEQNSYIDSRDYADHGGAFPIIIKDVGVIGTITISGLPQEEDHAMVVNILRDYLQIQ